MPVSGPFDFINTYVYMCILFLPRTFASCLCIPLYIRSNGADKAFQLAVMQPAQNARNMGRARVDGLKIQMEAYTAINVRVVVSLVA